MVGRIQIKRLHARKNEYFEIFRVEKFEFGVQVFKNKNGLSKIVGLRGLNTAYDLRRANVNLLTRYCLI